MIATASLPFRLTRPLIFIDCETTGTNVSSDRIVELSLVIFRPGSDEPEVRTRRLNPEIPIPSDATQVHGITDADVAGEPRFQQIADDLLTLLDECDLAGFGIRRFDFPLLQAEFARLGKRLDHRGRRLIDALVIFHREEPRDLSAAVLHYLDRSHTEAHRAEADSLATVDVLCAQIERYGLTDELDELQAYLDETHPFETEVDRWWDTSAEDPKEWIFKRGKHKGVTLGHAPRNYLEWIAGVDDMDADVRDVARNMLFGRYG